MTNTVEQSEALNKQNLIEALSNLGIEAYSALGPIVNSPSGIIEAVSRAHYTTSITDLANHLVALNGKSNAYWIVSVTREVVRFALEEKKPEFKNESGLEFTDISSESERVYNFGSKGFVRIQNPLKLNVSSSGGHRIYSADGKSHYIPSGWVELTWTVKEGEPNFVA